MVNRMQGLKCILVCIILNKFKICFTHGLLNVFG